MRVFRCACSAALFVGCTSFGQTGSTAPSAADAGSDATTTNADSGAPITPLHAPFACTPLPSTAYFCDDFESGAPSADWDVSELSPPPTMNDDSGQARDDVNDSSGTGDMVALGFDPFPPEGTARLTHTRPGGNGPLAMRFHFRIPDDAWSVGTTSAIAQLRDNTTQLYALVYTARGTHGQGSVELRAGAKTIATFDVVQDTSYCFSLGVDAHTIYYAGPDGTGSNASAGSAPNDANALLPNLATIGWQGEFAPGPGSQFLKYDDVLLSTAPITCD